MQSINRQILLGHLGADAESKPLANGNLVAQIRIATSESWRDKTTGEWQERTEWHVAKCFGKLAERLAELKKGAEVYLEGTTRTEKYTDKEGIERATKVVMIDDFKAFASSRQHKPSEQQKDASTPRRGYAAPQGGQSSPSRSAPSARPAFDDGPNPFDDDREPF